MKKVAVILAGCGIMDGSEVHESTCSLLAIREADCEYTCFSFDKEQPVVFNHKTKEEIKQSRNMMAEAGRIARLRINDIKTLNVDDFDILWIPGGRGTGYNLCSYFIDGDNYSVEPDLEKVIKEFHKQNKPICALCLAPLVLNKVLKNIKITVGNDEIISKMINNSGNIHINTETENICVDENNKIISSPCYMLTRDIKVVYNEATKILNKAIELSL